MSSNDGNINPHEDAYHYHQHHNIVTGNNRDMSRSHHLQRQQPHVTDATIPLSAHSSHHQVMWTNQNPNMMTPPLPSQQPQQLQHQYMQQIPPHVAAQHMQQTALQQAPIQPHSQQQQLYNDYVLNMHPVQSFGQPETYSVLPVGHGNFLKVYHCNDPPPLNEMTTAGIFQQPTSVTQSQQQQPTQQPQQSSQHFQSMPVQHYPMQTIPAQHHIHQQPHQHNQHVAVEQQTTNAAASLPPFQQPQSQQQNFNSYKLFSESECENRNITLNLTTQQDNNTNNAMINRSNNNNNQPINDDVNGVAVTTTNMIINELVNNWSPNLTGVAYTQFSVPTPSLSVDDSIETVMIKQGNFQNQHQQIKPIYNNNNNNNSDNNNDDKCTTIISEAEIQNPISPTTSNVATNIEVIETTSVSNSIEKTIKNNNDSNKNINTCNNNNSSLSYNKSTHAPETKKRIVAEVKPMRMTYSDVLSKANHAQQQQQQQKNSQNNNDKRNSKIMGTATQLLLNNDRKYNTTTPANSVSKKSVSVLTGSDIEGRTNKKSPIHEQKENVSNINKTSYNNNLNKRSNSNNGQVKNINQKSFATASTTTTILSGKQPTFVNDILNNNNNNNTNTNCNANININNSKKRNSNINNINNNLNNKKSTTNTANNNNNNSNNNSYMEKENEPSMRKASASTGTAATTINTNTSSSLNLNTKSSVSTSSNVRNRGNGNSSLGSNSSYSYSTKRNRNYNTSVGTGSSAGGTYGSYGAATNRNYELAKKLLKTWCEYSLKILTWLYYLVYDIVVISCSMAYDNLKQHTIDAWWTICYLRTELQQNSNKPGLWWRNFWRRFDARFRKNSRWAFWRRYYPKKPPAPATTETFKGGRLPQTGDEAMNSLLNCKGKNAYSILGVPPDSSQEQIRKHYKKIAVLVHPDKNKQAGAEEAFKVLQRAFELIGEPENRLAYDKSLAEALHAEKAWSEFHDLLSQLHTKINEAANTIRCSTCSLRHPRKFIDRPHYAARECASCKIRHSAREGDIWAESTMLGLRWKYLALMEGKVYDITEWANCQKGALSHLEPNSHMVQYRIVRGAQQQQQQQQQNSGQKQQRQTTSGFDSSGFGASTNSFAGAPQFGNDLPSSEASLHEFLDNLYSGQNPNQAQSTAYSNSARRRNRRN